MDTKDRIERSRLFQPGQSFGKFYLVQLLGEGGTSRIFKALQQPISRIVALKIPSFADSGHVLTPDEFLAEATLMARLEHANVVRIYDFGVHEDSAFICMEHVEGRNLQELCAGRPLPLPAVLAIAIQALEGLLYSHAQGVLHQDLSPANVLVSRQGAVKLSDFGMAGKHRPPENGVVVGTPAFLSPEHVAGEPCDERSDLFSFASLLYFAAQGGCLFDPGEDNAALAAAFADIAAARTRPPEALRRLPAPLAAAACKALAGNDPEGLLADLKAAWARAEGETRPEAALRRELWAEEAATEASEAPGSDEALRQRYLRLREDGRHREAMALLEKALRRRPDHPLVQELLAAAPARPKSGPVTMEVGLPDPAPARKGVWAALSVLALAAALAGLAAWKTAKAAKPGEALGTGSEAHARPAPPEPEPGAVAAPAFGPQPIAAAAEPAGAPAPAPARKAPPRPRSAAAPAPARGMSPALGISGPAFTRLILNDTVELFSPSPQQGWPAPPGLAKLALTRPDLKETITSSLFLSPDTFYLIRLEEDGGFSVSRRPR